MLRQSQMKHISQLSIFTVYTSIFQASGRNVSLVEIDFVRRNSTAERIGVPHMLQSNSAAGTWKTDLKKSVFIWSSINQA